MNSDDTPRPDDEVTLAELAALRAGELTAEEEARLRMRMAHDPEAENKLWALDNVHRLFAKPGPAPADLPTEMPHDVAARLQARLAEQALHREHIAAEDDGPADDLGERRDDASIPAESRPGNDPGQAPADPRDD